MTEIDDEPKFTRGEWVWSSDGTSGESDGLVCYAELSGDQLVVLDIKVDYDGTELWKDNSRITGAPSDLSLIAAAPDLYKALDDLLNDVNDSREVRQRGLRALKLARGEAVPSLDEDDADLAAAKSALEDFDVNGGTPLEDLAKEIER